MQARRRKFAMGGGLIWGLRAEPPAAGGQWGSEGKPSAAGGWGSGAEPPGLENFESFLQK